MIKELKLEEDRWGEWKLLNWLGYEIYVVFNYNSKLYIVLDVGNLGMRLGFRYVGIFCF